MWRGDALVAGEIGMTTPLETYQAQARETILHAGYMAAEWSKEVDECLAPLTVAALDLVIAFAEDILRHESRAVYTGDVVASHVIRDAVAHYQQLKGEIEK